MDYEGTDEDMTTTMSRKRNRTEKTPPAVAVEPTREAQPRVAEFVAPRCSACTSLRPDDKNYSRVMSTHRNTLSITRYCKCGFCGNTFKVVEMLQRSNDLIE